jgi:hypothetical protein
MAVQLGPPIIFDNILILGEQESGNFNTKLYANTKVKQFKDKTEYSEL